MDADRTQIVAHDGERTIDVQRGLSIAEFRFFDRSGDPGSVCMAYQRGAWSSIGIKMAILSLKVTRISQAKHREVAGDFRSTHG